MEWYEKFTVSLDVHIRPCREEDIPTLEWFGFFMSHRELIERQYRLQVEGKALMLVADIHGVASGQAWVDFIDPPQAGKALIWAVRIFPSLQGTGIGTHLIRVCERLSFARGYRTMELAVELENSGARRFYHRLGYEEVDRVEVEHEHHVPGHRFSGELSIQAVLRKRLGNGGV